jgi:hypothetical protein
LRDFKLEIHISSLNYNKRIPGNKTVMESTLSVLVKMSPTKSSVFLLQIQKFRLHTIGERGFGD